MKVTTNWEIILLKIVIKKNEIKKLILTMVSMRIAMIIIIAKILSIIIAAIMKMVIPITIL